VKKFRFSHILQSTACLHFRGVQCRCVWAAAVDRQARQSCCFWCGSVNSPLDKCVLRRSASGGRTVPPDTLRRTAYLSGCRADSIHTATPDTTKQSCLCRFWCELDDCSERVQTSNFLSATVLSCRESNSHRQSGRDTDKTVLSCLAWRCELASTFLTCPSICACMHAEAFSDPLAAEFSR